MITQLEIIADAKTPEEKYPFLIGAPFSIQLENGHQLVILYNKVSQALDFIIYDEQVNIIAQRQPLKSYPTNISKDAERVLYLCNSYIIDESIERFSKHAFVNNEATREQWNEAILEMQRYLGDEIL